MIKRIQNRSFYFLFVLAILFLTAAASPPAVDPPIVRGCQTACMIAADLEIKPYIKGDTTTLSGAMRIVDENGKPVDNAVIVVRWELPDGTTVRDQVKTDSNGLAVVEILAMQAGEYSLVILRGVKEGYHFDHRQGDCEENIWL